MTKKVFTIILLSLFVITALGFIFSNQSKSAITTPKTSEPVFVVEPINSPNPTPTNFTASFEIYTNGTKRIFTATMYHNQSDEVYIESTDPSVVYVTKPGTTWDDFFKTLPFSVNKQCLITGTKQIFCSNETQKLRFFINETEQPNALDFEIKPNDSLRVEYK